MTSDRAPGAVDSPKTRTPGLEFFESFLGRSSFSRTGSDGFTSIMAGFSELGKTNIIEMMRLNKQGIDCSKQHVSIGLLFIRS